MCEIQLNYPYRLPFAEDLYHSLVDNLDYVSDGIKNRLKIKVGNNFRLFSNAMSVYYSISLDGYLNRENEYSLSPVEKFPFKTDQISELKDLKSIEKP